MFERVAVAFRSGSNQVRGAIGASEFQEIAAADRADIERLDGILVVVLRTGGRRGMDDAIDGAKVRQGLADVGFNKADARLVGQMGDVARMTGEEVIDTGDLMTMTEYQVTEMRRYEAGGSRDDESQNWFSLFIV
jgi:hypothetical protein